MSVSSAATNATLITAYDFSFPAIDGGTLDLNAYRGRPLLIVNTASQCGFTPQYDALQAVYDKFKDSGLVVIGVPSNDFGKQETGTAEEIQTFCEVNFNITFPMTDKIKIKGDEAHDFYQWAKAQTGYAGRPKWNFHKYLIGTDGMIVDWFSTVTKPDSPKVIAAIESAF
ncbi:MAG: glutathione peroxidase [Candidatus Puniceispirillaceae bacterium]